MIRLIDATHFYSADAGSRGRGLFCRIDLQPGDAWWTYDLEDPRYIARVMPWNEYLQLNDDDRRTVEILSYIEADTRNLILCAEPFCRVNHATLSANSRSDDDGYSIITKTTPAGTEITIPYDYDTVLSILWKFPAFRIELTAAQLNDDEFLMQRVTECPAAMAFLQRFP